MTTGRAYDSSPALPFRRRCAACRPACRRRAGGRRGFPSRRGALAGRGARGPRAGCPGGAARPGRSLGLALVGRQQARALTRPADGPVDRDGVQGREQERVAPGLSRSRRRCGGTRYAPMTPPASGYGKPLATGNSQCHGRRDRCPPGGSSLPAPGGIGSGLRAYGRADGGHRQERGWPRTAGENPVVMPDRTGAERATRRLAGPSAGRAGSYPGMTCWGRMRAPSNAVTFRGCPGSLPLLSAC